MYIIVASKLMEENIRTVAAEEFSDARHAWILVLSPFGTVLLGVDAHGAQFQHVEEDAEPAHARLAVEDGTGRAELHGQHS